MPTIKDVAKHAGVGLGTVSRVVAGKGSVSAETAAKVRKAIEELGFRPSHTARTLPTGRTQTIGVFIPLIQGAFYTPILHAIYSELRVHGRHTVVAFGQKLEGERQQALEGAHFLVERGCDGLLIVGTALEEADLAELEGLRTKFVLLNQEFPAVAGDCFRPDHFRSGQLAARALLEKGHRDIAIIGGPVTSYDNRQRLDGFKGELARAGIDAGHLAQVDSDFSPEGGWNAVAALMERRPGFTALFCANDEMAVGALSWLHRQGVSVPRDLSVIGYDGTDVAEFAAPRLTTVKVHWRDYAIAAVHHLLNQCYGTDLPVGRRFPSEVVWRDSVLARPAAASPARASALAESA